MIQYFPFPLKEMGGVGGVFLNQENRGHLSLYIYIYISPGSMEFPFLFYPLFSGKRDFYESRHFTYKNSFILSRPIRHTTHYFPSLGVMGDGGLIYSVRIVSCCNRDRRCSDHDVLRREEGSLRSSCTEVLCAMIIFRDTLVWIYAGISDPGSAPVLDPRIWTHIYLCTSSHGMRSGVTSHIPQRTE